MEVNVKGLDRAKVIKALYDNSVPVGMGYMQYREGKMEINEAKELVKEEFLDYVHGRYMKCSFRDDVLFIADDYDELAEYRESDGIGKQVADICQIDWIPKKAEQVIEELRREIGQ